MGGFSLTGNNTMMVSMQILGVVMQAMTEAEGMSGSGTGEAKKVFAKKRARDLMRIQDMVKASLMTPEQEAATLETFDLWVEAIYSSWETAKLFQTPPPTPVV